MSKKILLTSVCRPMGPKYGDAPSVGYELLYRQVTRAQGIFSPRTVNVHFGLDYIAENLDAPTVVLQYPSKRELIRELKKGYDYVGVSFLLAVMHKMKETVALIRQYAPNSKIVLGGYGTVLKDEVLKPYADYICREEGVALFPPAAGRAGNPDAVQTPADRELAESYLAGRFRAREKSSPDWAARTAATFAALRIFSRASTSSCCPTGKTSTPSSERYLDLDPEPRLPDSRRRFSAQQKAGDGIPRLRDEGRKEAFHLRLLQHQGDQPIHGRGNSGDGN